MSSKSTVSRELLIATTNAGKVKEITQILGDLDISLHSLGPKQSMPAPVESGLTYAENAIIKASAYAKQSGMWALADDSGLEVDHLNGAPGLHSARFRDGSDEDRVDLLLAKLVGVEDKDRGARFVSVCAIVDSSGEVLHLAEGRCEGRIGHAPRGLNGFGYDPIFIPNGYQLTFAQLPAEIKNEISHRAKALALMREYLQRVLVAA